MAVCACLNASPESVAAGLCVDNVMALIYFPLVSVLASGWKDVGILLEEETDNDGVVNENGHDENENGAKRQGSSSINNNDRDHDNDVDDDASSPIEALSHAFTLAALLTALGQFVNSKLHHLTTFIGGVAKSSYTTSSSISTSSGGGGSSANSLNKCCQMMEF